jgi:hypothetical protein
MGAVQVLLEFIEYYRLPGFNDRKAFLFPPGWACLFLAGQISAARVLEGGDRVDIDDSAGYRPVHSKHRLKNSSIWQGNVQIRVHLQASLPQGTCR